MPSIRWLHLTDLHVGTPGMSHLWPAMKASLYRDVEDLHAVAGPFDVVLFSGDLVHSGQDTEYGSLTALLDDLWTHLRKLGSSPVLLAVPGNHDLARPSEGTPVVRALLNWAHDQDLRGTLFWDEDKGKEYRGVVETAFEGYVRWWRAWSGAHPLPASVERNDAGLLPGEFSATIRKEGLSLGIAGLNTSFLHLSGKVERGQLALHPSQLHRACGGDPNVWTARHHLCILMTHHPPEWLAPDAGAYYQGEIFLPDWFAGHVCGHLHEPRVAVQSIGGGPAHRLYQGASLFGMETWDSAQGRRESRVHGYCASRLELDAHGRLTLRSWPRIAHRYPATGRWSIVPDYEHFALDGRVANSFAIELRPRDPAMPPPSRPHACVPQPPGLGYDPAWYVPRDIEDRALSTLRQAGAPLILTGAPMVGTSTVLHRLVHQLKEERLPGGRANIVLDVDCASIAEAALDDADACLLELGARLVQAHSSAGTSDRPVDVQASLDEAWRGPATPERKLTALVEQVVLTRQPERVVVALDRFDKIIGRGAAGAVIRAFRRWIELRTTGRWAALRLMLAAAGVSLLFDRVDEVSEFFAVHTAVRVDGLRTQELRRLAALYGRPWLDEELERIVELVDGQPYLSRLILYLEATGTPKGELLDLDRLRDEHCATHLRQLWLRLKDRPDLLEPLRAILEGREISRDGYDRLSIAGLVRRKEGAYTVPNKLLAAYLREHFGSG